MLFCFIINFIDFYLRLRTYIKYTRLTIDNKCTAVTSIIRYQFNRGGVHDILDIARQVKLISEIFVNKAYIRPSFYVPSIN